MLFLIKKSQPYWLTCVYTTTTNVKLKFIIMTELQDLLFDVKMIDNPLNAVSAQSKQIVATFEMPEGLQGCPREKVLNTCSPTFNLLKNTDVYPVVEKMMEDAGIGFVKSYTMNKEKTVFHAVYILKELNGEDIGIDLGGNGDKIYCTLMVGNSYNGQKMGAFLFGYFRMICANGLVIPLEGKEESNLHIKGKHTKKLGLSFEELTEKIEEFVSINGVVKKKFEVLTDRMVVEFEERVLEVVSATGISVTQEQFKAINERIVKEAKELYKGDVNDFLIYNGINAHIYKGVDKNGKKRTALPEVKRTEDRKVFDYISNN